MNTPTQDAYKQIVQRIAELMKSYGFKKYGSTFLRIENENSMLVDFQRSTKSTKDEIIFTLNVGICSTRLFNYYKEGTDRQPTSEADCHLRVRIGQFLPARKDTWWSLAGDSNLDDLSGSLEVTLRDVVIPYLQKHSSDDALIALWESGEAPGMSEKRRHEYLAELKQLTKESKVAGAN